ncbi:DUF7848 domain-containing protein [Streptantibioticus parmotrematis]|uniref:DUF7848 domain-containing protein n=1 Tax=Streptantibioticus parmotrematis TaxID=2873249 RepID=UPI003FD731FA
MTRAVIRDLFWAVCRDSAKPRTWEAACTACHEESDACFSEEDLAMWIFGHSRETGHSEFARSQADYVNVTSRKLAPIVRPVRHVDGEESGA